MKFGLFYELSVPRPWTRESERTVYNNALEQVKLADELGFDQVWAVEHHFLEEYSHCPAPELFLTACAMLTKDIRVGHGIIVCVPGFNHPIKIAEKTAVLDILSGGRLEVGTGRSATWTELAGFNANPDDDQEELGRVRAMPSQDVDVGAVRLRGRVLVDAVADHPAQGVPAAAPADVGGGDEPGHGAGRRGPRARQPRPHVRPVRRAGEEDRRVPAPHPALQPVGDFVNDQVSSVNFLYCHEDDQVGRERGRRMADTFNYLATQLTSVREVFPGRSYPSARPAAPAPPRGYRPRGERAGRRGIVPGRAGARHARAQALGSVRRRPREFSAERDGGHPQAEVLDSLRLFAREVMPAFAGSKAGRRGRSLMPVFGELALRPLPPGCPASPASMLRRGRCRVPKFYSSPSRSPRARARCCPARCIRPSPYATWLVTRYPESPVGPFALAQLRLMGRAGAHPRGFVLAAVASTPEAARALAGGWVCPWHRAR